MEERCTASNKGLDIVCWLQFLCNCTQSFGKPALPPRPAQQRALAAYVKPNTFVHI